MVELGRDETAEPGPSDRDLTEDGTGRLMGLPFNNPLRPYCYSTKVIVISLIIGRIERISQLATAGPSACRCPAGARRMHGIPSPENRRRTAHSGTGSRVWGEG